MQERAGACRVGGPREHGGVQRGATVVVNRGRRLFLLACAGGLVSGCGATVYAPVSERQARVPRPTSRVVRPGDTVYNIAWESDLDYRDLARWNGIPPPYVIKPGQRLRLTPPPGGTRAQPRPSARRSPGAEKKPAEHWPRRVRWTWPTRGRVIRRFSVRRGNKGIDIAGRTGQPVRAAAAGRVVYRGSGLHGYGQLIIVKHNETFLSAYAHNEKLFSKEGDWVRRGQRIAAMGATDADRTMLHFEIRRYGVPVNPLVYLPRKRN